MAGAFLDGFLGEGSQESLGDWVDRYSGSRNAAGVYLYLHHKQSSDICDIEGSIIDYNENEIDHYLAASVAYDRTVKILFEDGQIVRKGGEKAKEIWIPFEGNNPKNGGDSGGDDDFDDEDDEDDSVEDDFDDDEDDDEFDDDFDDDDDDFDDDDVDFDDVDDDYDDDFDDDD
jgi:hypothetical protein